MSMPNHLPGNPYVDMLNEVEDEAPEVDLVTATLALAWEQRQANIIAYRVARVRGSEQLMEGLEHLDDNHD